MVCHRKKITSKLKPKLPIEVVRTEKYGKTSKGLNDWKEVVRGGNQETAAASTEAEDDEEGNFLFGCLFTACSKRHN